MFIWFGITILSQDRFKGLITFWHIKELGFWGQRRVARSQAYLTTTGVSSRSGAIGRALTQSNRPKRATRDRGGLGIR